MGNLGYGGATKIILIDLANFLATGKQNVTIINYGESIFIL